MDIYECLKADHDMQRDLASRIMATQGDSDERNSLWEQFKPEAEAHAAAEEQTFYVELMSKTEGQPRARHSVSEHKEAADLIDELSDLDMGSSGWIQKFETLKDELEHHMDEEENEVFDKARQLISDDSAVRLAAEFQQRKETELEG